MKYSSTDRPSRKLDLIGRGMISPRGLATRPRIPVIWRTWVMFPRAPEPIIISIGLKRSDRIASSMACWTSNVAFCHRSISSSWRSASVMRPMA
jgi:hypothetical protein